MNGDELTNLTRSQVEALLECFDFIANGYVDQSSFEVGDIWIIQLKHLRKHSVIRLFIRPNSYRLQVRGHTRKKVFFESTKDRFRIVVNSDGTVGVVRLQQDASLK